MVFNAENLEVLKRDNVRMKNAEEVYEKIRKLVESGKDRLQVVSDFDMTITKQHEDGKVHLTSFNMLAKCASVTQEFLVVEAELYNHYRPIETDPNISLEEKKAKMEEWWGKTEQFMKGLKVCPKEFDEVAKTSGPALRDHTHELFNKLHEADIPVLVFSAGLGDAVVAVLKNSNVLLPNVKVVSNFMKHNSDGEVVGFKDTMIHVLNKKEQTLIDTEYYSMILNRDNIILMGDHIGDAGMADGVPHETVIKIGFLYDHIEGNLPAFLDAFDIVLIDDQSMDVINALVSLVISSKN